MPGQIAGRGFRNDAGCSSALELPAKTAGARKDEVSVISGGDRVGSDGDPGGLQQQQQQRADADKRGTPPGLHEFVCRWLTSMRRPGDDGCRRVSVQQCVTDAVLLQPEQGQNTVLG